MNTQKKVVIPIDDYAYLTQTKISHDKCPICNSKNIDGAVVIYGSDKKQRIVMCNKCLRELDMHGFSDADNNKNGYNRAALAIEKLNHPQKCACHLESKKSNGYMIRLLGLNIKCCTECFENLHNEIHKYNCAYNSLYLKMIDSINNAEKAKQLQEFENKKLELQKESDEYKKQLKKDTEAHIENIESETNKYYSNIRNSVYKFEEKIKKEAELIVGKLPDTQAIRLFYSFGNTDRERFANQLSVKTYGEIVEPLSPVASGSQDDFINSLILESAFPYVNCSLHHQNGQSKRAKYFLSADNDQYYQFKFTLCEECLNTLYHCLNTILSDVLLKEVEQDNISINRLKIDISEYRCYSCGSSEDRFAIILGNARFVLCYDCAVKLYDKLGKLISNIEPIFEPKALVPKLYPNYNNRQMICNKNRKSVILFGYSAEKAKKDKANFIVNRTIYPNVSCEGIGHNDATNANVVITTQRTKDNFCLVLCKTCIISLDNALSHNNYESNSGTYISVKKTKWIDNEHCMFCGTNSGNANRIRIGTAVFSTCDHCKDKLKNTLKTCYKE